MINLIPTTGHKYQISSFSKDRLQPFDANEFQFEFEKVILRETYSLTIERPFDETFKDLPIFVVVG